MKTLKKNGLALAALLASLLPSQAWAFAPGMEEKIADVMVWFVIILVPIALIYLFWKVHVLPEVFAEKHPYTCP